MNCDEKYYMDGIEIPKEDDAPEYRRYMNAPSKSSEKENYDRGFKDGIKFANEWISVKDKLPNKNARYLVVFSNIVPDYAIGFSSFWTETNDFNHTDITHWMPLPELPK